MKGKSVYVVMGSLPYEGSWVEGIFEFEDDASGYIAKLPSYEQRYATIEEWTIE